MNHEFCRQELLEVRHEAAQAGVTIPRKMAAIRSTDRLFFVQGSDGDEQSLFTHGAQKRAVFEI